MRKLFMVSLLLSQFAVGTPLAFTGRSSNNEKLYAQSPPILAIESFEDYYIAQPQEWHYPVTLPMFIAGGMKMVANGRGDTYITYLQSDSLGENGGGGQHFRSSGGGLRSSIAIYFPHKVQAFGFFYSGYDGYEATFPEAPWNTLTAYYQGGHTRFPPSSRGGFSIESPLGFDNVGIEMACIHPERRCETTFGLDDIWFAGDLGPVTTPEPGTWILVASGICAVFLGRTVRK